MALYPIELPDEIVARLETLPDEERRAFARQVNTFAVAATTKKTAETPERTLLDDLLPFIGTAIVTNPPALGELPYSEREGLD